ncbi:hypothetical protein PR003_g17965 [Phytophthora rubi]|uniref:Uncharacterized protein n=1 Tax=Phytophthora rubi TaxID=129364 RepID=A0A6A3KF65_9STRA|nr:hypothetical protein PR002_g17075 [Phytophthora rubi]KAE9009044.1 hypothetical protein PR001_g16541 [Phytophthora rubi]KAE9319441.1 hypothetical protein PR003_g17965 [Phytophthora rubi]
MGHFNQNESMTLVSQSPVVSHHWSPLVTTSAYWTTIKSMVVQNAGVDMMIKPMILSKSVLIGTCTSRSRVASSVLGSRSSVKECWLLRAERCSEYGDFDHFDPPTLL